jgi:type III pantothenate kinase
MNIAIDIGNSRVKLGIFKNKALVRLFILKDIDRETISGIIEQFPIEKAIVSTVKNLKKTEQLFPGNFPVTTMESVHHLPYKNLYETPETLGQDRKALVSGALSLFPGQHVLIISAGTAITYDFVDAQAQYHGGAISPGMNIRFQSLNTFTGDLPLANYKNHNRFIGKTTFESIASGVMEGITGEMKHQISLYEKRFGELKIIFTGGDAKHFDKTLKNNIFAISNLVLVGLNEIMEINV